MTTYVWDSTLLLHAASKHLGPNLVHGSLWLLCRGIVEVPGRRPSVARFCDHVLGSGIRWPFGIGGFETWAMGAKILPPMLPEA